jgi:hypothetical protein
MGDDDAEGDDDADGDADKDEREQSGDPEDEELYCFCQEKSYGEVRESSPLLLTASCVFLLCALTHSLL